MQAYGRLKKSYTHFSESCPEMAQEIGLSSVVSDDSQQLIGALAWLQENALADNEYISLLYIRQLFTKMLPGLVSPCASVAVVNDEYSKERDGQFETMFKQDKCCFVPLRKSSSSFKVDGFFVHKDKITIELTRTNLVNEELQVYLSGNSHQRYALLKALYFDAPAIHVSCDNNTSSINTTANFRLIKPIDDPYLAFRLLLLAPDSWFFLSLKLDSLLGEKITLTIHSKVTCGTHFQTNNLVTTSCLVINEYEQSLDPIRTTAVNSRYYIEYRDENPIQRLKSVKASDGKEVKDYYFDDGKLILGKSIGESVLSLQAIVSDSLKKVKMVNIKKPLEVYQNGQLVREAGWLSSPSRNSRPIMNQLMVEKLLLHLSHIHDLKQQLLTLLTLIDAEKKLPFLADSVLEVKVSECVRITKGVVHQFKNVKINIDDSLYTDTVSALLVGLAIHDYLDHCYPGSSRLTLVLVHSDICQRYELGQRCECE